MEHIITFHDAELAVTALQEKNIQSKDSALMLLTQWVSQEAKEGTILALAEPCMEPLALLPTATYVQIQVDSLDLGEKNINGYVNRRYLYYYPK